MYSHKPSCITHLLLCRPIAVLFLFGFFSCKPLIHSFSVAPLTITADDSVKIKWSVRGDATLLTHTDTAVYDNDEPRNETREYTLVVVNKKGKETKKSAFVNVLPQLSSDDIVFPCVRNGDTLLAAGEKDILRWGSQFIIQSIASASGRDLTVSHMGRAELVSKDGKNSTALAGLPNSGEWEIKTLLTPAERTDTTLIPGKLRIHTIILHKK